jgi:gag-polyprotein putative aspartyl protease/Zinc knuckle
VRFSSAERDNSDADSTAKGREIDALRTKLERCCREIEQLRRERDTKHESPRGRSDASTRTPSPAVPTRSAPTQTTEQPEVSKSPRSSPGVRRRSTDICRRCGSAGHWARDCDNTNIKSARGVGHAIGSGEVYLPISIVGKRFSCLLDTGCEKSLIPRKLVSSAQLYPTDQKIFAANGSEIRVLGSIGLEFSVGEVSTTFTFIVSDEIEEMMLGIDFLSQNDCHWNFQRKIITINGKAVTLQRKRKQVMARRVYAAQDIIIPPRCQTHVATRTTMRHPRIKVGDWLMEPKQVGEGLLIARTLVSGKTITPSICVLNLSDKESKIREGVLLGEGMWSMHAMTPRVRLL